MDGNLVYHHIKTPSPIDSTIMVTIECLCNAVCDYCDGMEEIVMMSHTLVKEWFLALQQSLV